MILKKNGLWQQNSELSRQKYPLSYPDIFWYWLNFNIFVALEKNR